MPSLFKSVTIDYRDAAGRRCGKGEPGAVKVRIDSKVWYGRFKGPDGRRRTVALCANKSKAEQMLAKLMTDAKMGRLGLVNPFEEHSRRPLAEHLADFRRYLEAKGNTARHAFRTFRDAGCVLEGCRFELIAHISPSPVVEWLAAERALGRFGARTSNYYLRDLKSFCRWLVKDGRTDRNPLAHLSGVNANGHVRRERRTLSGDEYARLVAAARAGDDRLHFVWQAKGRRPPRKRAIRIPAGPDRAVLYLVATYTGFRVAELASLTPESFDLDADPGTVRVRASYSKRRRDDVQPLRADLVGVLREWLARKPAGRPLWPGHWPKFAARMVGADLDAARATWIEEAGSDAERARRQRSDVLLFSDAAGRVFDFHAFRHQFITNLAAAGVHPKVAQALARHSTIGLTMDRYTHLSALDHTAALDQLPSIPGRVHGEEKAVARATGTDSVRTRFVHTDRSHPLPGVATPAHSSGSVGRRGETESPRLTSVGSGRERVSAGEQDGALPGPERGAADYRSRAARRERAVRSVRATARKPLRAPAGDLAASDRRDHGAYLVRRPPGAVTRTSRSPLTCPTTPRSDWSWVSASSLPPPSSP